MYIPTASMRSRTANPNKIRDSLAHVGRRGGYFSGAPSRRRGAEGEKRVQKDRRHVQRGEDARYLLGMGR
ncbi:hypothetical protein B0T14DRAFT_522084 [Immersiella caudata]|uniref:Uncharacterized protein n=1 Tax=Immersiella caudata TaxID=314043 RepID=A0AA39WSG5_9PEZI|nr:hypothetical protein B0T14DRAFT_522084 [Immersiella caudata]